MYLVHTFFSSMYWSCTKYILVRTAQKCMFWSTYLSLKVCTWYILAVLNTVCTGMYSVHTLFIDLVLLFFRFCGVHTGTYWGFLCTYFAVSAMFCRPALPCRFACKRFMHWNTYSTKAHYIGFINCLAGPLPVPASALHHWHDWALALACWGMQLRRVSFERLSVVKFWDDDQ
jgi:hypothetical protein